MCDRGAFNSDLIPEVEIKRIIDKLNIKTVIETGTFKGFTTKKFSELAEEVYSIEIAEEIANQAKSYLSDCNNVKLLKGDSATVLPVLLQFLKCDLPLFYLDAHWYNYWPLLTEITTISQYFKENCVIVIDDFQVPGRPQLGFDTYKGTPNNLAFIKESLDKCFQDPFYYFNSTSNMTISSAGSGKIYIFPNKFKELLKDFVVEENGILYSNL